MSGEKWRVPPHISHDDLTVSNTWQASAHFASFLASLTGKRALIMERTRVRPHISMWCLHSSDFLAILSLFWVLSNLSDLRESMGNEETMLTSRNLTGRMQRAPGCGPLSDWISSPIGPPPLVRSLAFPCSLAFSDRRVCSGARECVEDPFDGKEIFSGGKKGEKMGGYLNGFEEGLREGGGETRRCLDEGLFGLW